MKPELLISDDFIRLQNYVGNFYRKFYFSITEPKKMRNNHNSSSFNLIRKSITHNGVNVVIISLLFFILISISGCTNKPIQTETDSVKETLTSTPNQEQGPTLTPTNTFTPSPTPTNTLEPTPTRETRSDDPRVSGYFITGEWLQDKETGLPISVVEFYNTKILDCFVDGDRITMNVSLELYNWEINEILTTDNFKYCHFNPNTAEWYDLVTIDSTADLTKIIEDGYDYWFFASVNDHPQFNADLIENYINGNKISFNLFMVVEVDPIN